jgi:hypothetical protein
MDVYVQRPVKICGGMKKDKYEGDVVIVGIHGSACRLCSCV